VRRTVHKPVEQQCGHVISVPGGDARPSARVSRLFVPGKGRAAWSAGNC
jgi:hypothetical protein